jgi:flagella basal body P-ring formation protein FlgA
MKIAFIITLLFSVSLAWACELSVPQRLLIAGKISGKWAISKTDCSAEQISEVHALIQDQDGVIPVARLQAALGSGIRLISANKEVRIDNIESLIRRSYPDVGDATVTISSPFQGALIELPTSGDLMLHCHPCQFSGEEIMRLSVRNMADHQNEYNFQAKFVKYVDAYQIRQPVPAFSQKLTSEMFEQVKVPAAAYGQYLTDLSRIAFYKTNKSLRRGDILKVSDLSPLTLVRAGDRVELVFENPHVKVKSQALSRQNGGMGDQIEVWNQATGKKYRGVIVDHNRVVVDL